MRALPTCVGAEASVRPFSLELSLTGRAGRRRSCAFAFRRTPRVPCSPLGGFLLPLDPLALVPLGPTGGAVVERHLVRAILAREGVAAIYHSAVRILFIQ